MTLLDGPAIAHHLDVSANVVRQWHRRHPDLLPSRGRDHRGRSLFDLDEAIAMKGRPSGWPHRPKPASPEPPAPEPAPGPVQDLPEDQGDELLTVSQVAEAMEVTTAQVTSWARHHPDLLPRAGTRAGRGLYRLEDAENLVEQLDAVDLAEGWTQLGDAYGVRMVDMSTGLATTVELQPVRCGERNFIRIGNWAMKLADSDVLKGALAITNMRGHRPTKATAA